MNNENVNNGNNENNPISVGSSLSDIFNSYQDSINQEEKPVDDKYDRAPMIQEQIEAEKKVNRFIDPTMVAASNQQPVKTVPQPAPVSPVNLPQQPTQSAAPVQPQQSNVTPTVAQQQPAVTLDAKPEPPKIPVPESVTSNENSYQLKDETIGTLKKDNQKSPLAVFIIFALLVAVIFFIPQITPYFDKLLTQLNIGSNEDLYDLPVAEKPSKNENDEETKEESTLNILSLQTIIKIYNLEFTKFKVNGDILEYKVKNTASETFSIKKSKLYIDTYDENNTFLGSLLIDVNDLEPSQTVIGVNKLKEDISDKINKIQIVERSTSDYPNVTLIDERLVCSLEGTNVTFRFNNNIISSISENTVRDETESLQDYLEYQGKINQLNEVKGVTAVSIKKDNQLEAQIEIRYSDLETELTEYSNNYYPKETDANQIKYEMNAKGYICN